MKHLLLLFWIGTASYYSISGCLGCSPNFTMANGQPLKDMGSTIAFNWLPLNTKVRITNLDNRRSLIVTVTDRHGAYNAKYKWRIADVTVGVARWLDMKTDVTRIKIETL